MLVARSPHQLAQRPQRGVQTRRVARPLQTDQRRHQVVRRQVRPGRPHVQDIVSLRRPVRCRRREHVRHLERCRPTPGAVVEDHRQDRRQRAVLAQHAVGDQALKGHRGVGEHAHGHRRVDGGLELEEQHEVQPVLVAEADAPDEVGVALPQVFADEGGGQGGQGVEVERVAPAACGEAVEQVADHARARKKQLVGGVVHGCSRRRPASRVRGVRGVRGPRRIAGGPPPADGCPGARKGPTRERPAGTGERTPTEGRRRRNCDAGRPRRSQRPPPLSISRIGAVSRRVRDKKVGRRWAGRGAASYMGVHAHGKACSRGWPRAAPVDRALRQRPGLSSNNDVVHPNARMFSDVHPSTDKLLTTVSAGPAPVCCPGRPGGRADDRLRRPGFGLWLLGGPGTGGAVGSGLY